MGLIIMSCKPSSQEATSRLKGIFCTQLDAELRRQQDRLCPSKLYTSQRKEYNYKKIID